MHAIYINEMLEEKITSKEHRFKKILKITSNDENIYKLAFIGRGNLKYMRRCI